MINLPRMLRLVRAGEFDRLLNDSLRSNRLVPLRVRLRLSEPESLPAAAIGIALQRVVDLTYKPTEITAALLESLLTRQRADGTFGNTGATVVAAAALGAVARQLDSLAGLRAGRESMPEELSRQLHAALDRAAQALTLATGDFGGRLSSFGALDPIDGAIILWRLVDHPRLAAAANLERVLERAERRGLFHDPSSAPLLERLTSIRPRSMSAEEEPPLWSLKGAIGVGSARGQTAGGRGRGRSAA